MNQLLTPLQILQILKNPSVFAPIIENEIIAPLLAPTIAIVRKTNPELAGTALQDEVAAALKHALRHHIGFFVDILFSENQFIAALNASIQDAIGATEGVSLAA